MNKILKYLSLSTFLILIAGCSVATVDNRTDAINNSQAMHRATMKPYTINGKTYKPTMVSVNDVYTGVASWYGKDFHGKKTSNGEIYNMYALTAAHKTLPMNTMVKVTHLDSEKSVIVRINDRGPFVKSRVIDLSYAAADRLGIVKSGTAPVRLEILGFDGTVYNVNDKQKTNPTIVIEGFDIQIGSFRSEDGANRFVKMNQKYDGRYTVSIRTGSYQNKPIYRVWIRGFESEAEAQDFISANMNEFRDAFIVREQ